MFRAVLVAGLVPLSLWAGCKGLLPTQFVIDRWGPQEGLPEEKIVSVTQTPDGYLWLATLDGIVRFDGKNFQVFRFGETQALPANYWRTVFSTSAGELLAMRSDQKLMLLQPGAARTLTAGGGPTAVRMIPFREDGEKRTWIPTFQGVFAFHRGQLDATPAEPASLIGQVTVVAPAGTGRLWMGTNDGAVYLIGPGRKVEGVWKTPGRPPIRSGTFAPEPMDRYGFLLLTACSRW